MESMVKKTVHQFTPLYIYYQVVNGRIIESYENMSEVYEAGVIDDESGKKLTKWYMDNVGIGAIFEKNIRLVELANGEHVWWVDLVDNDFEDHVADWIFDEKGNTLFCHPNPKEFSEILIKIDRKHGLDEWGKYYDKKEIPIRLVKEYCPTCKNESTMKEIIEEFADGTDIYVRVTVCPICGENLLDELEYLRAKKEVKSRGFDVSDSWLTD
ncbi:MAG: hypothetical protein ACE5KT_01755 [Methanosarcinales archaeon]